MMVKVGVTGGIGSGKSLVCNIFKQLGIPIYNADIEAKKLLLNNDIKNKIVSLAGNDILNPDNQIDKKIFALKLFNNQKLIKNINQLIHPLVISNFNAWSLKQLNCPFVIEEAALIFESNNYQNLDYTILINTPESIRIERVIKRDNSSKEDVLARIKNQLPDEEKMKMANFVIFNTDDKFIIPQVLKVYNEIINKKL